MSMNKIISYLDNLEKIWALILLISILAIMSLQIICRYFLQSPMSWPEELAVLLNCYLTFVGVSLVHRRKGHMAFTILVEQISLKGQKVLDVFVHLLSIAVFAAIVVVSIDLQEMQSNFRYFAAFPITKNYFTLPVTICGCSVILNSLHFIVQDIFEKEDQ